MAQTGLGSGFWKDASALDRAYKEGVITKYEYRQGLRAAGLVLTDDEKLFPELDPDLEPLPTGEEFVIDFDTPYPNEDDDLEEAHADE